LQGNVTDAFKLCYNREKLIVLVIDG